MSKSTFFYLMLIWLICASTYFAVTSIQRDNKVREQQKQLTALAELGVQAHAANCALKTELENQIVDETTALNRSKAAFKKDPNLLPTVPRVLIQQGLDAQQATINRQARTVVVLDKFLSCGTG